MSVMLQVGVDGMDAIPAKFKAAYDAAKPFADLLDTIAANSKNTFKIVVKEAEDASKKTVDATTKAAEAQAKAVDEGQKLINKAHSQGANQLEKLVDLYGQLLTKTTDEQKQTDKYRQSVERLDTKIEEVTNRMVKNKGRTLSMLFDEQNALIQTVAAYAKAGSAADDYLLAIRKLEFETDDERKATAEYKEVLNALKKAHVGAALAADEQSRAQAKVAEHYGNTKKNLSAVEDALEGLHLPGSGVVTVFKKLADAQEQINETGTPAQVAMLNQAIAMGKVVAVGAVAVAGVLAVGAAMAAATVKAAEWNDELAAVGLNLDAQATAKLKESAAAVTATGTAFKALAVTATTTFAPAVEGVSLVLGSMALQIRDGYQHDLPYYAIQIEGVTRKLNAQATATAALTAALDIQKRQLEIQGDLSRADDALRAKLIDQTRQERMARLDGVDAIKAEGAEKLRVIEEEYRAVNQFGKASVATTEAYENARAEIIKTTEAKIRDERGKTVAKTAEEQSKLFQRFVEGNQAEQDAIDKTTAAAVKLREEQEKKAAVDAVKEVTDAYEDEAKTIAAIHALEQKEAADAAKAMEEKAKQAQDSWVASFDTIADSAEQLSEMMIKSSKRSGDAAEKAAVVAFVIQKAAGLASVAIRTSEAIMAAMTLPPPASYVAAAAAAIAGATQAAAILSQEAPSRSGGTAKQPSAPNAPNLKMGTTGEDSSGYTATQQKTSSQVEANTTSGGRYGTIDNTDGYTPPSSSVTMTRRAPGDATLNYQQGGANDPAMIGRSILDMLGEIRDAIIDQTIAIKQGGIGRGGRSVIYAAAPASSYTR